MERPRPRLHHLLAFVAVFGILTTPAYATPIPAGSSLSSDLLLNFDLHSQLPVSIGQFATITLSYSFTAPGAGGGNQGGGGQSSVPVVVDVFGNLGGDSFLTTFSVDIQANGVSPDHSSLSLASLLDGIFSVGVRVAPGVDATLNNLTAFGTYIEPGGQGNMQGPQRIDTSPVSGTVVIRDGTTSAVPEPSTLTLFALGFAACGRRLRQTTTRRRRSA